MHSWCWIAGEAVVTWWKSKIVLCEVLLLFTYFTSQSPSVCQKKKIIFNQSLLNSNWIWIRGAIIHNLRLFALIWNINGFFWLREEMSIWSQRSSATAGVYPLTLPSSPCIAGPGQEQGGRLWISSLRNYFLKLWICIFFFFPRVTQMNTSRSLETFSSKSWLQIRIFWKPVALI